MRLAAFDGVLILTGPTGSGKSRLALDIAERSGAEIVSMDSMSLYRGMDIGTAKPGAEERRRVPHHLLDVLDPWESSSVAWWLDRAAAACAAIKARGKRPLLVGGTALYLKAVQFGLFEGPAQDEALRRQLEGEAARVGAAALHQRLAAVDEQAARRIHPQDLRRVVRALEVWQLTGRPISSFQQQWRGGRFGDREPDTAPESVLHACVWLDLARAELYARINRRVEAMFASGLVEEVRALRSLPRPVSREAAQALGYKEVFAYLEGQHTLAETVELVQTRSRQFAKRQITWFRHLPGCRPIHPELTATLWTGTMK